MLQAKIIECSMSPWNFPVQKILHVFAIKHENKSQTAVICNCSLKKKTKQNFIVVVDKT